MTLDRPLRSHSDFLKLWAAQTVSLFGSQVTTLALPLAAILTLHAGPLEVGALNAAGSASALVASLPAEVWIDRLRRRPAMIAAGLGQALILASIPLAFWLSVLRLPQLVLVAFLAAALAVFFDVAYRAYLPSLVPRSRLIEANSRMTASKTAAQIGASGLAGALIQVFGAPVAILADAVSFVVSSFTLLFIRMPEPKPASTERVGIRREGVEEVRTLLGSPPMATASSRVSELHGSPKRWSRGHETATISRSSPPRNCVATSRWSLGSLSSVCDRPGSYRSRPSSSRSTACIVV